MSTLGKAVQFPQTPLSISLVSFAASAVAMPLRLVLNSIRSVSSRAKSTSQEISSLILSSSRRINNNLTNKIFVRRYCHHLDDDGDDDRKPPLENIERRQIYAQRTPTPVSFGVYYQRSVIDTALFAVNFHNQKENAQLQFVRALKADYILRGGLKLYITSEVQNAGKFEVYRTIVFYRPWDNYREIQEWERVEDHPFPCSNCFD